MMKIFFQMMLNEVLKNCENDTADGGANVKQQEKKEPVAVSYKHL